MKGEKCSRENRVEGICSLKTVDFQILLINNVLQKTAYGNKPHVNTQCQNYCLEFH